MEKIINRDGLENSNDWATPAYVYRPLYKIFHFDFDPCPLKPNFDGLMAKWGYSNFINPPYDKINKPKFILKTFTEWERGGNSVLLIPNATETGDFYKYIYGIAKIWFVKKRIKFEGYNTKGEWVTNKTGKQGHMVCIFQAGIKSRSIECIEFVDNKIKFL